MEAVDLSISTQKIVFRGIKCRLINNFSCYDIDSLPVKYFDELPYCFVSENIFNVFYSDGGVCSFKKKDIIPEKEFNRAIRSIRFSGKKLHLINEEIKKLKKEWNGKEDFKI